RQLGLDRAYDVAGPLGQVVPREAEYAPVLIRLEPVLADPVVLKLVGPRVEGMPVHLDRDSLALKRGVENGEDSAIGSADLVVGYPPRDPGLTEDAVQPPLRLRPSTGTGPLVVGPQPPVSAPPGE